MSSAEVFTLVNGTCAQLETRLEIPPHIPPIHILAPYMTQSLYPDKLDVILVPQFDSFFRRVANIPRGGDTCDGLYMSKNHCWFSEKNYEKLHAALRKEFGIDTTRAVLLPNRRPSYWSFVHEALHDVFSSFSAEQRQVFVDATTSDAVDFNSLKSMLDLMHLHVGNFSWKQRKPKKSRDDYQSTYTFSNMQGKDQLWMLDEFIAHYFTTKHSIDRNNHIPSALRKALIHAGYKFDKAPVVTRDEPRERFVYVSIGF